MADEYAWPVGDFEMLREIFAEHPAADGWTLRTELAGYILAGETGGNVATYKLTFTRTDKAKAKGR